MEISEFIDLLEGVKRTGKGWIARCPAHEDKNPSLSITERDGKLLLKCHAECTTEAIVEALGLTMRDLFSGNGNGKGTGKGETRPIISTYDYHDPETGQFLFQEAHFATKPKSKPRHKGPDGKWRWGAGTSKRPLYGQRDLRDVSEVCITEGPKDAFNFIKLGFPATCTPFGKWEPEHAEALKGKDLFIFWDNDDPGRKKRDEAVKFLRPIAKTIRIVNLPTDGKPEGYDVSDFISEFQDPDAAKEKLCVLMAEAKAPPNSHPSIISAGDLLTLEIPKIKWAVKDVIPEGLTLLAGKPKMGKSILALNLCISVALGTKALGYADTERGVVLYLALEDVKRRLKARLAQCLAESSITMMTPETLLFATEWPRMGAGGLQKLEKEVAQIGDMRMVVIDTLKMIRPIEKDTTKRIYDLDYEPIQRLKTFADRHRIAVVVVHHLRKSAGGDVMDDMSGSFGLTGASDTNIVLSRSTAGVADAKLHIVGRDVEATEYAMQFTPSLMSWNILGFADQVVDNRAKQTIIDAISEYGELRRSDLLKVTDIKERYLDKVLFQMVKNNLIQRKGRGIYSLFNNGVR